MWMHELDDNALLREFAEHGSHPAFAELVARHVNKVYSVAWRHTRNPHSAEEITQAVFVMLAQKAGTLGKNVILSGWLYQTARLTAVTLIRSDIRRAQREQEVLMQNHSDESAAADPWPHIAPLLDDAMAGLSETDRHAVVLRYFDGKSLKEVGVALGGSEDAAKMRVHRAVEKLRTFFTKRGVTLSAAGLTAAITVNSVQSAPIGLAAAVTAAALSGTALTTTAVIAATKTITMTTLQKTIVTAALAVVAGAGIYEARQVAQLREQNQTLQQQQVEQTQGLRSERGGTANRSSVLADENERLKGNSAELLKLRGEVAHLRNQARELEKLKAALASNGNDSMESAAKDLLEKVDLLKHRIEKFPDKKIPEIQFLTPTDWLNLAINGDPKADKNAHNILFRARMVAKERFAPMLGEALRNYTNSNAGRLPDSLGQLKSYFAARVEDALLERYEFLSTGNLDQTPWGEMLVKEKTVVDTQDSLYSIGLGSYSYQMSLGTNFSNGGGSYFSGVQAVTFQ